MTEKEIEQLAEALYLRLTEKNKIDEAESDKRIVIVYEDEEGYIIESMLGEITRLKDLLVEYELEEKYKMAQHVATKIKRLEDKIMGL